MARPGGAGEQWPTPRRMGAVTRAAACLAKPSGHLPFVFFHWPKKIRRSPPLGKGKANVGSDGTVGVAAVPQPSLLASGDHHAPSDFPLQGQRGTSPLASGGFPVPDQGC